MRLFTALVPPADALGELRRELRNLPAEAGIRWVAPEQWHITLAFFGEADAAERVTWLRPRLSGLPAPRLWLSGAGAFRGVLWAGVGGDELAPLAAAAGADTTSARGFHPHLTLARGRPAGGFAHLASRIGSYRGPAWRAAEVVLLRSDRVRSGTSYTAVERFRLDTGAGEQSGTGPA